jgi:tetratricopeptide (TPR) repeat protein
MLGTLFGRCPACGNKSIKKELLLARKETLPEFKKIKEQFLRRLDGYFKTEEPHGQVFRGAVAETVKSCETSEHGGQVEPVQNAVARIFLLEYIYTVANRCFFVSPKYAYFHNPLSPEHINPSLFLSYREPDCHEDSVRSSIRGTVTELYEIPYESFYTVKTELYNSIVDARLKQIEEKASKAIEHNSRGLMLYNEGKYDEAIEAYKKAIEWDPALASAYNNLGLTILNLETEIYHWRIIKNP